MSLIWQNKEEAIIDIRGRIWVIKNGKRVKQTQMTLDDFS